MFGGLFENKVQNDFLKMDLLTDPMNFTHYPKLNAPDQRKHHCLQIVGGKLLLFGGDSEGKRLNEL